MTKMKPLGSKWTKAGLSRGTSVRKSPKKKSRVVKKRVDNYAHLKHIFKGQYRSLLYKPTPQVITPEIAAIRRSIALRILGKRSPTDSALATLLGTASSTAGSLPVVGVPLTSLLSTLPTSALSSPGGAVTGLLGTLTGAAQSAPVLGDLLKMLPLSSLLKGNPLDNLKSSLSGLFVAIPVLGAPLNGLAGAASAAASSLPISLFDSRFVSPPSSQRTVTEPDTDDAPSPSTPLAAILGRSLKSGRFIAAREH